MKKINKVLLVGFFVVAVILFSKVISPIDQGLLQNSQSAALYNAVTSPVSPVSFWQFNGTTTTAQKTPTVGSQQFGGSETPTWTVGTNGLVGNYVAQLDVGNTAGNLTPSNAGWAVEFLMKPAKKFSGGTIFSFGNNFSFSHGTPESGANTIVNGEIIPAFKLTVNGTENWIPLDGVGRKSLNYYTDDNWHHFVFQYDPSSTDKKIQMWVDGQLAQGFYLNQTVSTSGPVKFSSMNSGGFIYIDANIHLDQVALYDKSLPPNLIVEHKINANAGLAYNTTAPTPYQDTTDSVVGVYNPLDFMAGTNLASTASQTPGVSVSVLDQLESYPLPRYKPGNTLIRNFSGWLAPDYMANRGSSSISGNSIGNVSANHQKAKEINKQLATKWNYSIFVDGMGDGNGSGTGDGFQVASRQLANDSSLLSIPTGSIIIRGQEYNNTANCLRSCIASQNLPSTHYLQNSSGQFINLNGQVTTGDKFWRPLSTYLSTYAIDGQTMKNNLQMALNAMPNRVAAYPNKAIDIINENGEVFPPFTKQNSDVIDVDTAVKTARGTTDTFTYVSNKFYENEKAYANEVTNLPALQNSIFTEYAIDGQEQWRMKWNSAKKVNDQINGQYYATPDFYPRYPNNWRFWNSAWHGWTWIVASVNTQLAETPTDNLYSPFVSAGWDSVERTNIRPAQMLGLTKSLAITGAEFFYPGVFNLGDPFPYPENWAWQATYPSYVQGVTSYYEDVLRTGKVMKGDSPYWDYGVDYTKAGFRFETGNPSDLVLARKKDGANKFVIFGMENPWSNWNGVAPEESVVDINFGGATVPATVSTPTENLKFKVRRQGSTYIYDKTVTPAVFYQLDAWHESSHPWHWSKDFSFEAEVYDTGTASRTTTTPAGTPAGDYTTFTTYINPSTGSTTYNFEPRDAASNSTKSYYVWALVKSTTGTAGGDFKIDNISTQTISTSSPTFVWCRATNPFAGVVSNSNHVLTHNATSANFQVDKLLITSNANLNLGNCGGGVAVDHIAPVVGTISTSPVSPITSGPVTISATATDDVAVASVEFKVDGNSVGIDTTSPYTASWALTGVSNGTHTITATATDTSENVANGTLSVTISVPDTTAPTTPTSLTATRSSNNAVLAWGGSTDSGSGLAGYYVYRDASDTALNTTAIVGTGYTDTPTANTNHTYIVKAKDNSGNYSTASNQVSINIDTAGPTTSGLSPTNGSTVSGTVTMSVTASDSSMIDHIDFYSGATIICSAPGNNQTSGTFTCSWNTSAVANGTYSITAKVYDKVTNPGSNSTTTTANSVTVSNIVTPPADTTAPSTPTGLTATATSTSQINLSWTASTDSVGVTGYKIYRCTGAGCTPTTQIGSSTTTSYSNTGLTASTVYIYRVAANDAALNNSGYSTTATATTQSAGLPDVIVIDISWLPASPAVGSNVVFSATLKNQGTVATPAGTIAGVMFTLDGVTAGCADGYTSSIAPGATVSISMGTGSTWCTSGVNAPTVWNATTGTHTIVAIADDVNRFAESDETNNTMTETITVTSDTVNPVVSITGPTSGTVIVGGTTTTIGVNATDSSGIQNVKVYIGGTQYGTDLTTSPYSVSWNTTGFTAGAHTITAVATDNAGNSATSATVTVSISVQASDTTAPTLTITSPANNANISNTSPVTFSATATDNVAVTQVKFFLGTTSTTPKCTLTTPTTPPNGYSCNITIGTAYSFWKKTINVQVKDATGNTTTKSVQVY